MAEYIKSKITSFLASFDGSKKKDEVSTHDNKNNKEFYKLKTDFQPLYDANKASGFNNLPEDSFNCKETTNLSSLSPKVCTEDDIDEENDSDDFEMTYEHDESLYHHPIYLEYKRSGYIYWAICKHSIKIFNMKFFCLSRKEDAMLNHRMLIFLMAIWKEFRRKNKIKTSQIKSAIKNYFHLELVGSFDSVDYQEVQSQVYEFLNDCQDLYPLTNYKLDSKTLKEVSKKIGLTLTVDTLFKETAIFTPMDDFVEILKLILNEKEKKYK